MRFWVLVILFDNILTYCALLYLYNSLCGLKDGKFWQQWLLHLITVAGFIAVNVTIAPYILRCLAYATVSLIAAAMFGKKWTTKFVLGLMVTIIEFGAELVIMPILSLFHDVTIMPLPLGLYTKGVFYARLLALAVTVLISKILTKRLDFSATPPMAKIFWFLLLATTGFFVLDTLFGVLMTTPDRIEMMKLLLCIAIICAVWLYLLFNEFDRQEQRLAKQKYRYMLALQKIQEENWQTITAKNQKMRILTHDVKNFLLMLRSYLANDETSLARQALDDYLDELMDNHTINSGILMFDTVLAAKAQTAKENHIAFQCTVLLNENALRIAHIDIARIFANALDNAIEAASQIADATQRRISLEMRLSGDYLHIAIENTIARPIAITSDHLTTTKTDKDRHGLGLQSMQLLANKYHGKMFLHSQSNIFSVIIILRNETPAEK